MHPDTVDRGNLNAAAEDFFHFLDFTVQTVVLLHDFFETLVEAFAFAGQVELFLRPVDDQRVKMLFHGAELLTYCRLRNVIELCRFGKTLALNKITEDFQVFYMHDWNEGYSGKL